MKGGLGLPFCFTSGNFVTKPRSRSASIDVLLDLMPSPNRLRMKRLLLTALLLICADSASAQSPLPRVAAEDIKLSYYDPSLPTFEWYAPANYNPYLIIDLGQRFTLPTESGFVDSVRIYFGGITEGGARLTISLYADTLFDTGVGFYRLMNDYSENATFGSVDVETAALTPNAWNTIPMGHVKVPKEFFVRVSPEDDGQTFISDYTLRSEQETVRARTTENSRSAFFGAYNGQYITAILDSTFYSIETGDILIGDLWMEAFVDVSSSGVAQHNASSFAMYPNPVAANQSLHIESASEVKSVVITNLLGVEVGRWAGSQASQVSTNGLTKGVYYVTVQTADGARSEKLIVN